ncbi:MAG: GNAT family N-acetyltransferase [Microbacterium pygmaeum]
MTQITIAPATADRFDDAEYALTGGGDGASCQCQWWMMPNAEFQALSTEERRERLQDEIGQAPPPALIAYVDGVAAGWVRVGPRSTQPRLARTQAIAPGMQGEFEDSDVWAITCFVTRREYRGQGVQGELLDAAISFAREHGARSIEGYPIDTSTGKHPSNDLYHGVLSTFERHGFREVARPKPDRVVVAIDVNRSDSRAH